MDAAADGRCTMKKEHLDLLVKFMERYPRLALASRNRDDLDRGKRTWNKIAKILNQVDPGITKNATGWKRYWADVKFKIRRKYSTIRQRLSSGNPCQIYLSKLEERMLKILTDNEGNLITIQHQYHNQPPTFNYTDKMECQLKKIQNRTSPTKNLDTTDESDLESVHSHIRTEIIKTKNNKRSEIQPKETPDRSDEQSDQESVHSVPENILEELKPQPEDPIRIDKTEDELRREMMAFQLQKQKELFVIEKQERKERHQLEMDILELRKKILMKELKKI